MRRGRESSQKHLLGAGFLCSLDLTRRVAPRDRQSVMSPSCRHRGSSRSLFRYAAIQDAVRRTRHWRQHRLRKLHTPASMYFLLRIKALLCSKIDLIARRLFCKVCSSIPVQLGDPRYWRHDHTTRLASTRISGFPYCLFSKEKVL